MRESSGFTASVRALLFGRGVNCSAQGSPCSVQQFAAVGYSGNFFYRSWLLVWLSETVRGMEQLSIVLPVPVLLLSLFGIVTDLVFDNQRIDATG
ncbi:hypothetical protein SETIT_2G030800v2 [Setaria italica]|uniref:Uncharacterized protein n=1 Tax=Setaria italica TaxID=4555 RepID=A0A368PUX7_SETIT|nr:hypothetical protein SETIT_2G030800v2 [Setaria italica]